MTEAAAWARSADLLEERVASGAWTADPDDPDSWGLERERIAYQLLEDTVKTDTPKRGPGRPPRGGTPRRFRVVMTDQELAALKDRAAREGVKVADLIRSLAAS